MERRQQAIDEFPFFVLLIDASKGAQHEERMCLVHHRSTGATRKSGMVRQMGSGFVPDRRALARSGTILKH
jgi:hypothetical protein